MEIKNKMEIELSKIKKEAYDKGWCIEAWIEKKMIKK